MDEVTALLKSSIAEAPARLAALLDERKKLERELADVKKKLAMSGGASSGAVEFEEVNGVKLMTKSLSGIDAKELKSLADEGKKKLGSGVVVLLATGEEGKASLVVGVTEDLIGAYNAIDLVNAGVAELGGKRGGGRPDMAQGGGPDASKADAAIEAIRKLVKKV